MLNNLEWLLDQEQIVTRRARRVISDRHRKLLLSERRRKRTRLDWLLSKGLIDIREHKTGRALAMLIEWRAASLGAGDSTSVFRRKFEKSPPTQIPYQVDLIVVSDVDDKRLGQTIDADAMMPSGEDNAVDLFNQTLQERLRLHTCAVLEIERVTNLLTRALPERPDLMTILGHCVTERVTRHEIGTETPILRAALHLVFQLWRHDLLEDLIDEATGIRQRVQRDSAIERYIRPTGLSSATGRQDADDRPRDVATLRMMRPPK
jgi:hypothetical protein